VFASSAYVPTAVLQAPVVLALKELKPIAVLRIPSVLASNANEPTATFYSLSY
jgi:hypothetical protein